MNARTLAAVAACTRTLAQSSDADEALGDLPVGTLGPLRAAGDRAALRRRFHDDGVHASWRPAEALAGELADALEQARLDAIGVTWLAGVARNLLAYPGAAEDSVRWLAFEVLSGAPAPQEKRKLVDRARGRLPSPLLRELSALAVVLHDQRAFGEAAADWCRRAAGEAGHPPQRGTPPQFDIPNAPAGVHIRNGRYALPGRTQPHSAERAASDHAADAPPRREEPVAPLPGYRAFTTAYDRVVDAATLASPEEMTALRMRLDADFTALRSLVARMAKRLMRVLMAKQAREWRFDQDDGQLDASRLSVFVATGGAVAPFKQEFESPFPSTVVSLLIDHSGSMAGRKMQIAALTVEIFARVLERCGVGCEVLGFTTRDWDGGEPARRWAEAGYPPEPGRLNALEHIVIKAAEMPWRRARRGLGLFLRDEMLKENIDGEALTWAHQRLLVRPERRRILIVISDGTPMDEATCAANGFDYLDGHLAAVVRSIETRSPVRLAAVGIGHDVSQFYSNATRISHVEELGPALSARIESLLDD